MEGHGLQISNAHLDWEGGSRHRMRQLKHLREALQMHPSDFRIVTGDFNTIAPKPLRRLHERRVERTLGAEFRNAFPRLPWSYDLAYTDPSNMRFIATLSKAGLKWRQRFDYMFAKDMTVLSAKMHDLPGSDHRPLIATFALSPQKAAVQ
jgi:endonuclease/exonuclease/phosphatase family metal-dependent hydrolase